MKTLLVSKHFETYIFDFLTKSEIHVFDELSLEIMTPKGYNLIIWDTNRDIYPVKDKGSVLICVSRDDVGVALSKVFEVRANAVIIINTDSYDLVDALGNLWCRTTNPVELLKSVFDLYDWNRNSVRKESVRSDGYVPYGINIPMMDDFCEIIRDVSDKVEKGRGGRYFGNASTRCSKMFPSIRSGHDPKTGKSLSDLFQYILVSKRNILKDKIKPHDFVVTRYGTSSEDVGKVIYFGEDKPSVDTPSQIWLYKEFPNINFMIHGHAYLKSKYWTVETKKYCSCGDLREVSQVVDCVKFDDSTWFIINLKNHGFIIGTETLERMKEIVDGTEFIYRNIGEEKPII